MQAPFDARGGPVALSNQELAVWAALADARGRVLGRTELMRRSGIGGSTPRRCDSVIVGLRRAFGPDAIVTVRGRGWRCPTDLVPGQGGPAGPPV